MGDKPNVVVSHILEDIDQDQDPRHKETEQEIRPIRDGVRRIQIWIQKKEDEQYQPGKEKREKKEVEIHGAIITQSSKG